MYAVGKNFPFYVSTKLCYFLSMIGFVFMISITFHNLLVSGKQILENIWLLVICMGVIWMWVMVNKVRRAIWSKRNIERQIEQEHLELVATEDVCEEHGPGRLLPHPHWHLQA